ncbi:MAG: 6-phosphofructokinase [Verrucomicrobiota bacterium]
MKRIAILTAGGDTPALNATIHGAVVRANQLKVEIYGLIKGFNFVNNDRVPHVHLNPLFQGIPELDPTRGGTVIGASRDYVDSNDYEALALAEHRLKQLGIDGLICVGGDGTLNGLQPLAERFPAVLAPKTIDNDLGLNFQSEPDEWVRDESEGDGKPIYSRTQSRATFHLEQMVNYVTPGYATSVFVSAGGVGRLRTTAESHRRIAIIEVMGRHSGYITLGTAYGQPDIILVPEHPVEVDRLVDRIKEIYELQKNVVIACGEGIVDENGNDLGAEKRTTDPAGNLQLSGAAEALRSRLMEALGDGYFDGFRRGITAREAIFTRKVGHTQRGGRPILFDRFYAAQLGAKSVDMLLEGQNNALSILQWTRDKGFYVDAYDANRFRDRWGLIHAREMHPSFYDADLMKPSQTGIEYLLPIFSHAIGDEDMEHTRQTLFAAGNLTQPYHSLNTDLNKRIRFLKSELPMEAPDNVVAEEAVGAM